MAVKRDDVLSRQAHWINERAQKITVAILGCGGLGSNIALMLGRMGIGKLIIYDDDVVEVSNLNRQNYGVEDIGKKKIAQTKKYLKKILPYVTVEARDKFVDETELKILYDEADIFLEAFDSVASKMCAYDFFLERQKPYICTTGVAGPLGEISRKQFGHMHIVGDFNGEDREDCYIPKVMAIAAMECRVVLEIIVQEEEK